jgi:hypothetical protein
LWEHSAPGARVKTLAGPQPDLARIMLIH